MLPDRQGLKTEGGPLREGVRLAQALLAAVPNGMDQAYAQMWIDHPAALSAEVGQLLSQTGKDSQEKFFRIKVFPHIATSVGEVVLGELDYCRIDQPYKFEPDSPSGPKPMYVADGSKEIFHQVFGGKPLSCRGSTRKVYDLVHEGDARLLITAFGRDASIKLAVADIYRLITSIPETDVGALTGYGVWNCVPASSGLDPYIVGCQCRNYHGEWAWTLQVRPLKPDEKLPERTRLYVHDDLEIG